MNVLAFARDLPKVELHCHLEGAARPSTIAELARRNGVELPTDDPVELFEFTDLDQFLSVYGVICASLVTADDFRRLTYEALEDAVASNVRYREMFFSPGFPMALGVSIDTVWDGIRAGLADAHHDLDVKCRIILDFDKPSGPGPAAELVEFAGKQDRDLLVGRGRRLHRTRRRPPRLRAGVRTREGTRPPPHVPRRARTALPTTSPPRSTTSGANASTTASASSTIPISPPGSPTPASRSRCARSATS